MSGERSPVEGPVPPDREADAYDRLRRRVLRSMPTGLYLIGSRGVDEGRPTANLMTASLVAQVSVTPKLVAVSVEAGARTARLIEDGRCFSVCLLDRADRQVVRRFVKPVADVTISAEGRVSALNGELVVEGRTGAPVLARSPLWVDCALREVHPLGSHVLFLGEVVDVGGPAEGGVPDLLRMEDTRMSYGG